jgi:Asp-tRNA(Asn)/Glu-tRNA(Gln) amidotransferase C subunit
VKEYITLSTVKTLYSLAGFASSQDGETVEKDLHTITMMIDQLNRLDSSLSSDSFNQQVPAIHFDPLQTVITKQSATPFYKHVAKNAPIIYEGYYVVPPHKITG